MNEHPPKGGRPPLREVARDIAELEESARLAMASPHEVQGGGTAPLKLRQELARLRRLATSTDPCTCHYPNPPKSQGVIARHCKRCLRPMDDAAVERYGRNESRGETTEQGDHFNGRHRIARVEKFQAALKDRRAKEKKKRRGKR